MKNLFKKAVSALSDRLIDLNYRLEEYPMVPPKSCSKAETIIDDIHLIYNDLESAQSLLIDYLNATDLFSSETCLALSQAYSSVEDAIISISDIDGIFLKDII